MVALVGYQIFNASVWCDVLKSLGIFVDRGEATRVWLESESMKWLPGGVWGYGSRVLSSQKMGVKRASAALSLIWEVILTNIAWGLLALTILFSATLRKYCVVWCESLEWPPLSIVLLGTTLLGLILVIALKRYKPFREFFVVVMELKKVSLGRSFESLGKYTVLNAFNLTALYLVVLATPEASITWHQVLAIGSIAWFVGFWAIGVPGGIGVREAALVFLMTPFMALEAAMAVAIIWRLTQMSAEIIAVVFSVLTRMINQNKEGEYETA